MLVVATTTGCRGRKERGQVKRAEQPRMEAASPRIEFGSCSGHEQTFVSGSRMPHSPGLRIPRAEISEDSAFISRAARDCYGQARRNRPRLAGKITLHLAITPSGTVAEVEAIESFDSEVENCIFAAVRGHKFSKGETARETKSSIVFRLSDDGSDEELGEPARLERSLRKLSEPAGIPMRAPAAPSYETPLRAVQAAFETCGTEHLSNETSYNAVVIDLAPSESPVVRTALENPGLATCLTEAARVVTTPEAMRCPVAVGEMPIEQSLLIAVRGDAFLHEGRPITLEEWKRRLEERRASIRESRSEEAVALMGPVVVRVRREDSLKRVLDVIHTAGTADFSVALALEDGGEGRLLRGALPWVPVHREHHNRPDLPLRLDRTAAANLAELETKFQAADRNSIVSIEVDVELSLAELLPVLDALSGAGLDDWRLSPLKSPTL